MQICTSILPISIFIYHNSFQYLIKNEKINEFNSSERMKEKYTMTGERKRTWQTPASSASETGVESERA